MEEQQALLGRNVRPSLFSPPTGRKVNSTEYPDEPYEEGGGGSSSEGSDSWWEDSHSSCSSCLESSEEDWEDEVSEEGELLYIEAINQDSQPLEGEKKNIEPTEPVVDGVLPANINKQGKFVRWIRRRESKRQRPRLSVVEELNESPAVPIREGLTLVNVDLQRSYITRTDPSILGLQISIGDNNSVIVRDIMPDGPLAGNEKITSGDCLKTINGEDISSMNLEKKLSGLALPCQVTIGFLKRKESGCAREKVQSKLVQRLLEGDLSILTKLAKLPIALMAINTSDSVDEGPDADLIYCFPPQSCLQSSRGAFVTLGHLLPSVVGSDCQRCACQVKGQEVNVVFEKEDDLLILLALPEKLFRAEEVTWIAKDLIRCLKFNHQTLHLCFQKDVILLNRFLSSFFSRILLVGNSGILDVPLDAIDSLQHHFHEFMPAAPWVPLPREAQLQLDDALNELESGDFGHSGEDAQDSERLFIVLGSCLYHRGYLLVSHFTKDDLLDVHSFLRQNGILQLSKEEGVARMILWREVHPSSVRRGLPPKTATAYPPPVGRWFLLLVASGQDILAVLLENAGCCLPLPRPSRPHTPHVQEAEDTLAHIQSLGLTSLAAQWLSSLSRPRTTIGPSGPNRSTTTKDKAWGTIQRPSGANRIADADKQEDSTSQTTSNVSNPSNASESDENIPILGRRAERSALLNSSLRELSDDSNSDSEDSDSDWGSFKGLGIHDNGGLFDNPYMPSNVDDLDNVTPSKITTGPDNLLLHFVHIDGNEGVVITPGGEISPTLPLMALFSRAANNIHAQLQHNVRFRSLTDPRGIVNKSMIAVKECGILLNAIDGGRAHWVVGRLFFTPKPREIYVCYSDGAPQNMLELAFRLVLGIAG